MPPVRIKPTTPLSQVKHSSTEPLRSSDMGDIASFMANKLLGIHIKFYLSRASEFQQCGILTSVDSEEPVQPPFKLRNSK